MYIVQLWTCKDRNTDPFCLEFFSWGGEKGASDASATGMIYGSGEALKKMNEMFNGCGEAAFLLPPRRLRGGLLSPTVRPDKSEKGGLKGFSHR